MAPFMPASTDTLDKFGLSPRRYVLMVSRLVPEKRHEDLIKAFVDAALPGWKLALVGGADHPDEYSTRVNVSRRRPPMWSRQASRRVSRSTRHANAGIFVLPSSHEGLPIVLLEAISYGLPVLSTDIPANLEIGLPKESYFKPGDIRTLAERIQEFARSPCTEETRQRNRDWVIGRYDWRISARETVEFTDPSLSLERGPATCRKRDDAMVSVAIT